MSIVSYIKSVFASKNENSTDVNEIISNLQDDMSEIKKAIANITTQKKRLEIQKNRLSEQVYENKKSAKREILDENENEAEYYIERKLRKEKQIERLESEISNLKKVQDDLVQKKDKLKSKIRKIKTKRSHMEAKRIETEVTESISNLDLDSIGSRNRNLEESSRELDREEIEKEVEKLKQ
jgi:phage shock protein A